MDPTLPAAAEPALPVTATTNRDYGALRATLLDLASERLPEWTDHSPGDLGTLLVELFAYVGDVLAHYQDRIAAESYLDTAAEPRSLLHLLRLIGYELTPARAASADLTLLFNRDATGTCTVPHGAIFATAGPDKITFRYPGADLRVELDQLPEVEDAGTTYRQFRPQAAVPADGAGPGGLPVEQVDAEYGDQPLGFSDGSAWQRFAVTARPLLAESLEVSVAEAAGVLRWQRQASLFGSGPQDPHFVLRRDEDGMVWMEFGDGRTGRVPEAGSAVRAGYRLGGGSRGNVAAGAIRTAETTIEHLAGVRNEAPASGGTDPEAPADAARWAPALFRAAERAVTAADYEALARRFGVAKAYARLAGGNRVQLFVAPAGGGPPSDTLKDDLRRWFADRRLLTVDVEPCGPTYVEVTLAATWDCEPYWFPADVQRRIEDAVAGLLSFDRVGFGQPLFLSKVYEAIEAVDGVRYVTVDTFRRAGGLPEDDPTPRSGRLTFAAHEIPRARYPAGIRLTRAIGSPP